MRKSSDVLDQRTKQLLAAESREPEQFFYLSFAEPKPPHGRGFLGACIVRAYGILTAVDRAWNLGINPGGEVLCMPVSHCNPELLDRLLTRKEAEEFCGGPTR